ncbi:hypothetical protein HYPBUDRAFT_152884 [Hyphopichia burtonii NRRL Y-1933]|uniref:Uncharacterized protein n=1 Tax=Hyphopichia burtonii NRRL Y-1933 TaxID=984485 RepID=A0A1E4RHV1_9ASCO|nr:hypothetical protein HYPBUDRAFT_152884 [Hyphopichia burtonii NRRL Y-1933]ODV66839.1 hypothetical protein HYPBUDRAFT_152884 [Hyphopichia burtonii NRRL Y-1933]
MANHSSGSTSSQPSSSRSTRTRTRTKKKTTSRSTMNPRPAAPRQDNRRRDNPDHPFSTASLFVFNLVAPLMVSMLSQSFALLDRSVFSSFTASVQTVFSSALIAISSYVTKWYSSPLSQQVLTSTSSIFYDVVNPAYHTGSYYLSSGPTQTSTTCNQKLTI